MLLYFLSPITAFAAISIPFTVNLSENVTVDTTGGTPRIAVDVGGVTRYATYTSGSGTAALTFTYDAVLGDVDLDGVTLSSPVQLNGGTMKDAVGNDATLTFTIPNTSGVKVNYPSLGMDFVYDADGRYTLNGNVYNSLASFLTASSGTFSRASVGTYFDAAGTLQTASSGTPRFDHDPITHAAKGILIEEARTNNIRNSTMQGAVAGAPGTVPTNWQICSVGGGATCTYTIIDKNIINGSNYVDIRFQGTMPAAGAYVNWVILDSSTSVTWLPLAVTDSVSGQIQLALTNGTFPFASIALMVSEQNASTYLANRTEKAITTASLSSTLTTYAGAAAAVNASVNNVVQPRLVTGSNGTLTNYDFTLRIANPQIEKGAFATSFIPTTTVAVTRAADNLTVPVGVWYNASTTTISGTYSSFAVNGYSTRIASLNDGTSSNVFQLADAAAGIIFAQKAIGGPTLNSSGPPYVPNTTYKIAGAMDISSGPLAVNNTLYNNTNAGLPLGITRIQIGNMNGGSFLNGWISNASYYPLRVANTQLQLLTQ